MQKPVVVRGQPTQEESIAPYFVEEVRKYLERKYGAKQLYENGLSVYTSLDVELQLAANRALDRGLRQLDKRRGFRKPRRNLARRGPVARTVPRRSLGAADRAGPGGAGGRRGGRNGAAREGVPRQPGVPLAERPVPRGAARLRIGRYAADLTKAGTAWTNRGPADLLRPGDLVDVRVPEMDEAAARSPSRSSRRRSWTARCSPSTTGRARSGRWSAA